MSGNELEISGSGELGPVDLQNATNIIIQGYTSIAANAFLGASRLTSISIPDSVTSIGANAFQGVNSLVTLNIPSSVTTVTGSSFLFMTSLTAINVVDTGNPSPVISSLAGVLFRTNQTVLVQYPIGNTATSYDIPSSVSTILFNSFRSAINLRSISIPDSVKIIGVTAFQDSTSLTSISIPNSVTSIGGSAFRNTTSLKSVIFNSSPTLKIIGSSAFSRATSLTSFNIPTSVTSIGAEAFYGATSLTSVTFDSIATLKTIGSYAFQGTSFTSITIPKSVTSIGTTVFYANISLTSIVVEAENPAYSSDLGVFYNKAKTILLQYPVADTRQVFVIPDSVTAIGSYAFLGAIQLISITIPASVTSIGYGAFAGMLGIADFTVASANPAYSADNIGVLFNKDQTVLLYYPLNNTTNFYDIPVGVTVIGDGAFTYSRNITSITIPSTVTSIGDVAFGNIIRLTRLTVATESSTFSSDDVGVLFNNSKTILLQYPIGNSRQAYTIPDSVTTIAEAAFNLATFLTSVHIPASVKSIDVGAFGKATGLKTITIPNSVTSIALDAFDFATNLAIAFMTNETAATLKLFFGDTQSFYGVILSIVSLTPPPTSASTSITLTAGNGGGPLGSGSGPLKILLESSIVTLAGYTSISDYAFAGALALTSISIPSSVTSIGAYAFQYTTNLTSIIIPYSVTSIGENAFLNSGLTAVFMDQSTASILDLQFGTAEGFYGAPNVTVTALMPIPIVSGWNLIGVSMDANISSIQTNPSDNSNITQIYANNNDGRGYQLLTTNELLANHGYWVYCPSSGSLYTRGILPTTGDIAIDVVAGWNLIGTSNNCTLPVATGSVVISSIFPTIIPSNNTYTLLANQGYWIKCSQSGSFTLTINI